jgi:Cation efflux family
MRRVGATSLRPGLKRALQAIQKKQPLSTFPSNLLAQSLLKDPKLCPNFCYGSSSGRTVALRRHQEPILSIRCFASMSSSDEEARNDKPCGMSGNFHSPFLGPCFSHLEVKRSSRGYEIEVFLSRNQQQRSFSSDGGGGESKPSNNSDPGISETSISKIAERRERRKRLTVLYPYNEQDILRKQKNRKEKALERTLANVNRALLGNMVIAGSKLFAWFCSQSSSMMSEFIHSVVDCANQYLLLQGLKQSRHVADRKHPYGYGTNHPLLFLGLLP